MLESIRGRPERGSTVRARESNATRRPIDVAALLVWAFDRFDEASREIGSPIGPAWSEDDAGAGLVRAASAAAARIDPDAEAVVEAARTLKGECRGLVIGSARSAMPPDWQGGSFDAWRRRASIYVVDELRARRAWQGAPACLPMLALRGKAETVAKLWPSSGRHEAVGCAVVHVDRADELQAARRRYTLWRECLVMLQSGFALRLGRWLATGPAAPARPWD